MVNPHPVDRRVESLHVGRALEPEDQRLQVRVHVPHGAAGTEPAGVTRGTGKLHPPEVVFADVLIEPILQHLLDELMWHQHFARLLTYWQRLLSVYCYGHGCDQNSVPIGSGIAQMSSPTRWAG